MRRGFSEDEARTHLNIAIDRGRYGELFDFDVNAGQISLERHEGPEPSDERTAPSPG